MSFHKGQRIVITKNLGSRAGYDSHEYYYSGTLSRVPLGSRGVLDAAGESYVVKLDSGLRWRVHPEEISVDEEFEKERRDFMIKSVSSLLEERVSEPEHPETPAQLQKQRKFEPKFNPREEFALWVRQEFPELKDFADRELTYKRLTLRMEEVMEAAKTAYEHALRTTHSCVYGNFQSRWGHLIQEKDTRLFALSLENFVHYIEHISANMGNTSHYGTSILDGREVKK